MKILTSLFFGLAFLFALPKGHSESENLLPSDCVFNIADGQIDCTEYLPNGNLRIVVNYNNILTEYEIDENGATLQSQELGFAVEFTLEIENNEIVKRDASGNIISQQVINSTLFDQYFSFEKVVEFDGGYILAAYEDEKVDWNFDPGLTVIKTDLNLTVLNTFPIESEGEPTHAFVHNLIKVTEDRFAIVVNNQTGQYYPRTDLYLFDSNLNIKFEDDINYLNQGYDIFPNANLRQTSCGYWYYRTVNGSNNCNYSCIKNYSNNYANFENDELVYHKSQGRVEGSVSGDVSFCIPSVSVNSYGSNTPYIDGGVLIAGYNKEVSQYHTSPCPSSSTSIKYKLRHLDANGDTLWQKVPDELYTWVELIKIGENYFLLDGEIAEASNDPVILTQVSDPCPTVSNSCPDEIAGFTLLGEFEGSKYFISNNDSQPADAQQVAQQNDGYLAVISSQEENDFLQQHISEMTYIGLNDVDSEGNLVWGNGDPLTFNNINPCSFCNENSEEQDYVIMAPWDGAWSFSSLWNSRKYIVEIPCDNSSDEFEITYDCPTEFPQTGIWEVPIYLTNNTATASNPFFLSLYLEGNGTGPNPQSTFATVTVPPLAVGESTTIILEADLPSILYYLPNKKTFPPSYISEFTYGDFYISASATVPVPTLPFDFYCKKYTTDLEVVIQNSVPTFTADNEVIYSVAVTNNGNEHAYNIETQLLKTVATSYSSGLSIVDYSADINNMSQGSWERLSGGNYIWYIPELGVGETATVDVVYHLDDPLEFGSNIPNTVTVDVSTTSGHLIDSNNSNNTSTFIFEKENTGGGDCPDEIAGFTLLGEFGDSKYFISNDASQPVDAQLVAQQNDGYLASINSQEENDFLQQHITEMTYIGLNDLDSEGNLVWENGDPLTFNNINPCSFCNENSEEQDFVIMAPWDGAWSFSSIWNSRKYIVEVPCNNSGGGDEFCGSVVNDDILSQCLGAGFSLITLPVWTGVSGNQLTVNAGDGNGNLLWSNAFVFPDSVSLMSIVRFQQFDNEIVFYGHTINPSQTKDGFLLKLDLDGNEIWRNIFGPVPTTAIPTEVVSNSLDGGYYLLKELETSPSPSIFVLIKTDAQGNFKWDRYAYDSGYTTFEFLGESPDGSKSYLRNASVTADFASILQIDVETGQTNWQRNANSQYVFTSSAVLNSNGEVILAYNHENTTGNLPVTEIDFRMTKYDEDGEVVWEKKLPRTSTYFGSKINRACVDNTYLVNIEGTGLVTMDSDGNFSPYCDPADELPDLSHRGNHYYDEEQIIGEPFTFTIDLTNSNYKSIAENFSIDIYHVEGSQYDYDPQLSPYVTTVDLSDVYFGINEIELTVVIPPTTTELNHFALILDAENTVQESNEDNNLGFMRYLVNPDDLNDCPNAISGFTLLGEFDGSNYFVSNNTSTPLIAQLLAEQNGGYLAVINSQAENDFLQQHISEMTYIGLNDVDSEGSLVWGNGETLTFNNINPCSFCNENSEEQDYVIMAPWDGNWSFSSLWNSRKYIVEIPCNGGTDNNLIQNFVETNSNYNLSQEISFEKMHPNPAINEIFITVNSPLEKVVDIQIFDARGALVKSEKMNLYLGENTKELSIADLAPGIFMVKIPQANGQNTAMRFVKLNN